MIAIPKLLLLWTAFYFLILAIPAIFASQKFMTGMQKFAKNEEIIRLGGLVAMIFAFLFLMVHINFDGTRYMIFSIIGYLCLIKGVALIRYPKFASIRAKTFYGNKNSTIILGIFMLLVAAFVTRISFMKI